MLRYAEAAFHDLEDERARAMKHECRARGIVPLGLHPVEITTDVTLMHGINCIRVGDLGARARVPAKPFRYGDSYRVEPESSDSLMVGINGRVAGLIHFRRSARPEAASVLRRLRIKRNLQVGVVSEQPLPAMGRLAASLGADFQLGGQSPYDRTRFLEHCRRRGFKVAYVGDCSTDPRTAAEAHVAISLLGNGISESYDDAAPIWLLQPRLSKLVELWDMARDSPAATESGAWLRPGPESPLRGGRFVWGFTSLASVVVTNLGTYGVHSRTAASIRSLERQLARSLDPWPFLSQEQRDRP